MGWIFVGYGVWSVHRSREYAGRNRWLTAVGGGLAVIGGLGFFCAAFEAAGGIRWLPSDFEWPIGLANGVLTTTDGKHVVPHTASGRIQVYNPDWSYVTGWFVDASGGTFKIGLKGRNHIEVITARQYMRYVYTIDGFLLVSATYKPLKYSDFPASGRSAVIPTHWWFWPFTTPFFAWIIAALGMALILFFDPSRKERKVFVMPGH